MKPANDPDSTIRHESTGRKNRDALTALCGLSMGCADVVPGVSGGTVALILGIYERLVTAISHVDGFLFGCLRRRQWKEAARHLDLRFLVGLGFGLAIGVVGMTLLMNRLLTTPTTRELTFAVFFGMILASAVLVTTLIQPLSRSQGIRCFVLGVIGVVFAYWVSTLTAGHGTTQPSYGYLFICGAIAICAMILPGISGALILLVLGVYVHLTEIPRNLLDRVQVSEGLFTILVFGLGCATGLIFFSKLLRWLLGRYHSVTMALLCGFMIGALRKLWPFQRDLSPDIEKYKHKEFELVWPEQFDGEVVRVVIAVVVSAAFVFVVDRLTRRRAKAS